MSSTPIPSARKGSTCPSKRISLRIGSNIFLLHLVMHCYNTSRCTCVVAALNDNPRREHKPKPAATERATRSTPASPTAPWLFAQSQRSMVTHAYASCLEKNRHIRHTRFCSTVKLYSVNRSRDCQKCDRYHEQVATGHPDHADIGEGFHDVI